MSTLHVHEVDFTGPSVVWDFDTSAPRWCPKVGDEYMRGCGTTLDPFPAYAHDVEVIRDTVARVQTCWAPSWDVHFFSLDREHIGRSNAYSTEHDGGHYEPCDDADCDKPTCTWVKDPTVGVVCFAGKRIPPHPATTRYLVAHEYGHHVEWMLAEARGEKHHHTDAVVRDYAELRGDLSVHHGSGGRWHDSAHEVFACDFRIIVCGIETGYWPHPGVPHPFKVPGLSEWWLARKFADAA